MIWCGTALQVDHVSPSMDEVDWFKKKKKINTDSSDSPDDLDMAAAARKRPSAQQKQFRRVGQLLLLRH